MSEGPNTHPSGRKVYYVHPLVPRLRNAFRIFVITGIAAKVASTLIRDRTVAPTSLDPYHQILLILDGMTLLVPLGAVGWLAVLLLGMLQYRMAQLLGIVLVAGFLGAVAASDDVLAEHRTGAGVLLALLLGSIAFFVAHADRAFGEGRVVVRAREGESEGRDS